MWGSRGVLLWAMYFKWASQLGDLPSLKLTYEQPMKGGLGKRKLIVFQPSTVFLEAMLDMFVLGSGDIKNPLISIGRVTTFGCNFFWPLEIPSPLKFPVPKSIESTAESTANPLVRPWFRRAFGSVFFKSHGFFFQKKKYYFDETFYSPQGYQLSGKVWPL